MLKTAVSPSGDGDHEARTNSRNRSKALSSPLSASVQTAGWCETLKTGRRSCAGPGINRVRRNGRPGVAAVAEAVEQDRPRLLAPSIRPDNWSSAAVAAAEEAAAAGKAPPHRRPTHPGRFESSA